MLSSLNGGTRRIAAQPTSSRTRGGQEQPPHAKTAWRSGSGSVAAAGSSRIR